MPGSTSAVSRRATLGLLARAFGAMIAMTLILGVLWLTFRETALARRVIDTAEFWTFAAPMTVMGVRTNPQAVYHHRFEDSGVTLAVMQHMNRDFYKQFAQVEAADGQVRKFLIGPDEVRVWSWDFAHESTAEGLHAILYRESVFIYFDPDSGRVMGPDLRELTEL